MQRRTALSTGRIQGLDGLRAIAIGLVLASRAFGVRGAPSVSRAWTPLAHNESLGVSVFFVITGFLITTWVVREIDRTGALGLGAFYLRRALRLVPAYAGYALLAAALSAWGLLALPHRALFASPAFSHLDALVVAAPFYLLWPVALARVGTVRATTLAATVLAVGPFVRASTLLAAPSLRSALDTLLFARVDAVMSGALLALLCERPAFLSRMRSFHARGGALFAFALVLASVYLRAFTPWRVAVAPTLEALGVAVCLHGCITHPTSRVGRVLASRPLRLVGALAYALFLVQPLFGAIEQRNVPLGLAGIVVAAIACCVLCERPLLAVRQQLSAKAMSRAPRRPVLRAAALQR